MTRSAQPSPGETPREGGVLVVSESATDGVLIKTLLKDDFDNVFVKISAEGNLAAVEFLEWKPKVLLLAFRDIHKAEQCYLGLYRTGSASGFQPHRTVLLCTKEAVNQAFELCRRGLFDDYVLFWPMTYDAPRLRMTIHRALAELAFHPDDAQSAVTLGTQARRILRLEALLSGQPARGPEHIEAAEFAVGRAECEAISGLKEESGRALGAPTARARPVVLIVDDDEFDQTFLSRMLKPEGYRVKFASSGTEALNQLHRAPVDIILMDFKLPDMNGMEVTRRLKEEPRLAAIPVIMISGNSERDVVLGSRRIGAVDFIVKPVESSVLLDRLRRLCSGAESTVAQLQ